ncbi:MAG: sugar kinase [Candidatus Omnitrophica bacterium]|nr:sugar kinase [Candidatus Omnitrophota bacterium]
MSILVVGSVAIDSVQTPFGKKDVVLGGSATYFSIAASFFNKVNMVAVVGEDFPKKYITFFKRRSIGIEGLEIAKGKTFKWKGQYDYDLNKADTIYTHLNVFNDFHPRIPGRLKGANFLFLANIDPELQYSVLSQMDRPRLVACDSMNYWIAHKKRKLEKVLTKVDIFLLNDAEARQFTGEANLLKAAQSIQSIGPKVVVIKKGEHGVLYLSGDSFFLAPAYPLESLCDPTGAGDTFAGGMFGFLSRVKRIDESSMRKAVIYGTILASFVVEDFSVNRLLKLSMTEIKARYRHFMQITKFS